MQSRRTNWIATILWTALALAVTSPIFAAVCASSVCADISSSFAGQIDIDSIHLGWETENEPGVSYYIVRRYDCGDPATCSVLVGVVPAAGVCNTVTSYQLTDGPPTPVAAWTYTLEAWRVDDTRNCAVDVNPQ